MRIGGLFLSLALGQGKEIRTLLAHPILLKNSSITDIFYTEQQDIGDGGIRKVDKFEVYIKIRQLLELGFTKTAVAKKLGISRPTLYRYLKKSPKEMYETKMHQVDDRMVSSASRISVQSYAEKPMPR